MKLLKRDKEYSRNKSIILLCGYAVFFIFVFIIIATGNSTDSSKNYDDYMDNESKSDRETTTVSNYEYLYKISDNTNIKEITGTKTSEKEIFILDGKKYIKKDNNIYLDDVLVTDNIFNIDTYSYKNIEGLLNDRKPKEQTTYEDGTFKEVYSINSKEYFDYMKEDKCSNIDCSSIYIDLIINKNNKKQIEKVNINLTNYYKYNYTVDINYSNINNIKEVSTN